MPKGPVIFCGPQSVHRCIFKSVDTASSQPGELTLTLPSSQASLAGVSGRANRGHLRRNLRAATRPHRGVMDHLRGCILRSYPGRTQRRASRSPVQNTITTNLPKPAQPLTSRPRSTAPCASPNSPWPRPALSVTSPPGNASSTSTVCRLPKPPLPSPDRPPSATNSPTRYTPRLYGLAAPGGERRSPLTSYSGRGSLARLASLHPGPAPRRPSPPHLSRDSPRNHRGQRKQPLHHPRPPHR